MTVNTTGKASPGDVFRPPPARIWNNMVDAGRAWADGQFDNPSPQPIRSRQTDLLKVLNNCGEDRRVGEIMEISGSALTTVTEEHKWLKGVEPDSGYFGILKEPVEDQSVGTLQVSGCCMALVNISSLDHTRADLLSGNYVLQSGGTGPLDILYAPEATGEQECVVRFAVATDRKLVMLCSDLPGRSETTGYGGGVMGAISQAAGAELMIDPDTGAVIVSDRRYTVDNIWDIDLVRGQYVAIEKGLIGTNWTPYAADCGRVTGSESWWEDYAASTFGCTDSEWNG